MNFVLLREVRPYRLAAQPRVRAIRLLRCQQLLFLQRDIELRYQVILRIRQSLPLSLAPD